MRTYLYRRDVPGGRIFTEDQLADAIHDGWVDSPDDYLIPYRSAGTNAIGGHVEGGPRRSESRRRRTS